MASDNQVSNVDQKPKIVTGFIHYDKDDDLTKIFNVLQDFRSKNGLKFSHHRGQIFFSVRSENLDELYAKQPFKVSKYSTRTTYECDQACGNQLVSQRDSFLRMTYQDGKVIFSSRTPPRIHYQLVQRVFKDTNTFFDKQKYVLIRKNTERDEETSPSREFVTVSRSRVTGQRKLNNDSQQRFNNDSQQRFNNDSQQRFNNDSQQRQTRETREPREQQEHQVQRTESSKPVRGRPVSSRGRGRST